MGMDKLHEVVKTLEDHGIIIRPDDVAFIQKLKDVVMVYVMKGGVVARFYVLSDGRVLGPDFMVPIKGVME